jgi:CubicO group peptidase (beta-lactamase class C family)
MKMNYSKLFVMGIAAALFMASFAFAQSPVTDEQIIKNADEYMEAVRRVDGFNGTILLARDGKPIVSKGYGMANIEMNVANAPENIFRLGSVTKQFTSMAIMMLQERGKLKTSDPMCNYIAECPDIWKPITIKHLLTHTSGITNYTAFPDFAKTTILPITPAEMTERLKSEPLEFVPGEKNSYSNSGYFLLGVIIEKASGKTYADFLQENIFTPLGMSQSGYDDPIRIIPHRAAGYQKQAGKLQNAAYMDMSVPYAAGSLYSTTLDLLKWDQALYTDKLISKASRDEMFTPWKGETGYAYGWSIGNGGGHKQISHGGAIFGFATELKRFPDDKITVVVLSNIQSSPVGRVADNLAKIAFGEKVELPVERKAISLDSSILEKYVGEYQIGTNIIISITLKDGQLTGELAGQSKFLLFPETETTFFSKDVNAQFVFEKDADGTVTGMTLVQGGRHPAKKIK